MLCVQLQNIGQLQNNSANGVMLITINRVIKLLKAKSRMIFCLIFSLTDRTFKMHENKKRMGAIK